MAVIGATTPQQVIERLRSDLAAFADPGSLVAITADGGGWHQAEWTEDGAPRNCAFKVDGSTVVAARPHASSEVSYASFLAGPSMANLRALARNTLQVVKPLPTFIAPRARIDSELSEDEDALVVLEKVARESTESTRVIFVSADAGVGKTSLLREAVRRQAEAYLSGRVRSVWLYVDAQARRLAALDEALASELDHVRARFPFDAVGPLVRTGAVVLVVDGFDELIGSVGAYDEAFNGLADFISNLGGSGVVVAAARSTYYEQEFLSRVNKGLGRDDPWELVPIRLREWSTTQRADYLEVLGRNTGLSHSEVSDLGDQLNQIFSDADMRGVAGKPFFVHRLTQALLNGELDTDQIAGNVLDRLVQSFLEREARKLLNSARSPLLSVDALRTFFDEVAIEMWKQESRELSRTTIRTIASLLGQLEDLDEDGIREVAVRSPYFAMLNEGSSQGSVTWEHDVYYAYFLSRPLAAVIRQRDGLTLAQLLRRGRLPQDAAAMVGGITQSMPAQDVVNLMTIAASLDVADIEQIRLNAGLLAAGRLAGRSHEGLLLQNLILGVIPLSGAQFTKSTLQNVQFYGTDLTGCEFVDCQTSGVVFFERVIVDTESTKLGIDHLRVDDFYRLTVRSGESFRTLYSPAELRAALNSCGLPDASQPGRERPIRESVLTFVSRIMRLYTRTNALIEAPDNDLVWITSSPYWPKVRKALIDSGLIVTRNASTSGQKVLLERTLTVDAIMDGLKPDAATPLPVSQFWDAIESI